MKCKNILAAALCLSMLVGTGCSLGKGSSSKTTSGYSFSSEKNKYDLAYFSFELSKDFSVENEKKISSGEVSNYDFTGGDFLNFSVYTTGIEQCTAEVSAQAMIAMINGNENDKAENIETETLDLPGLNAAAVYLTNPSDDEYDDEGYLLITSEGVELTARLDFKPDDRNNVKAFFKDIASTVKYTGTEHLPTEPQSYDCDFFSLNCGPEWYIKNNNKSGEDEAHIKLSYYYAKDMAHYHTPALSISVKPLEDGNDPKKAADKSYESKKDLKSVSDIERGTAELLGHSTETLTYTADFSGIRSKITLSWFSENGYLYTISQELNMLDEKGSEAELKTLIDNITIKKLPHDQVEQRRQEREAESIQKIEFCGAKLDIVSKFESQRELENSRTFHHNNKDMYIEMLFDDDFDGSLDDYIQRDVDMLGYINDLDKVGVRRVILSNMAHFETFDYTDKSTSEGYGKTMKCSMYYHEHNGDIFRFLIGYPEKDREQALNYLENMLKTLTFE